MRKYKITSVMLWLMSVLLLVSGYFMQAETTDNMKVLRVFIPIAFGVILLLSICVSKCNLFARAKQKAPVLFIIGIISILLLETPLAMYINGTKRWLGIGDCRIVRPATLLLLTTILMLGYMCDRENDLSEKSVFFNTYKVIIPVSVAFLMVHYDDFLTSYLEVVIIVFVFSLLFEKNKAAKVKMALFWSIFGIGCLYYAEGSIFYYLGHENKFGKDLISSRMEALQNANWLGEGLGMLTFKYDNADSFCIFIQKFGIIGMALILVFFLVLIGCVFYVFTITRKNKDIFGMAVTSAVGVHFGSLLVFSIFANLCYVSVVIKPPFFADERCDIFIYLFEIALVQAVLKENNKRRILEKNS